MRVDRIPNRTSPPAYLLREAYREGDLTIAAWCGRAAPGKRTVARHGVMLAAFLVQPQNTADALKAEGLRLASSMQQCCGRTSR